MILPQKVEKVFLKKFEVISSSKVLKKLFIRIIIHRVKIKAMLKQRQIGGKGESGKETKKECHIAK